MDIDNVARVLSGMGALAVVLGVGFTIVVVAGVFFLIWRIFSGLGRANAERERLLREGMQAPARILSVAMGGMTMTVGVHRHLQLKLTVEVQPSHRPAYQAVVTTMISELQIPQVQPGLAATVRYDPNDPSKVVLESLGVAAAGAVAIPAGGSPRMPLGAKIGLIVGGCGALVGIGAAILAAVVAMGVGGFGALGGFSPPPSPPSSSTSTAAEDVCARAIRCCETVARGKTAAANCANLGRFGVPTSACESALSGYEQAARAAGKKCQ
jgi:hypothetical protein